MSDNLGETQQHCTVTEVPQGAPFTEIKDYQTTPKMPHLSVTFFQDDFYSSFQQVAGLI